MKLLTLLWIILSVFLSSKKELYAYATFNSQSNGEYVVKIKDNEMKKEKFIVSNLIKVALIDNPNPPDLSNIAVLYGGIGNKIEVEINGIKEDIPIEPVGVIVIGIDGLRQDVLYPSSLNDVDDPYGNYYVDPSTLPGLGQILIGNPQDSASQRYIMLPEVTAIFPSITLASWASIFTGKMPNETGIPGNEFFARDLINKNISVPERYNKPPGIISFGGGAFQGYDEFNVWEMRFSKDFFIPYQGNWSEPVDPLKTPQNDPDILKSKTLFESIKEIPQVQNYYSGMGGDPVVVANFHYARGAYWLTWDVEAGCMLVWTCPSETMDQASWDKFEDYLGGKYRDILGRRNDVPFSALTAWYLPGLDHHAHFEGMGEYLTFFEETTDPQVREIVNALKQQDEFDNKIFIVVADHGHTAMPEFGLVTMPDGRIVEPDTSCKLNVKDFDDVDIQDSEKTNNNLHIWELGEVFRAAAEESGLYYKVLAPDPIARLFKDKNQNELPYGATSDINKANVISALNGPMAHIYLRSGDSWKNIPSENELSYLAIVFMRMLQESGVNLDDDVKNKFSRLLSSIDKILIRVNGIYKVFNGFDETGNLVPPDDIAVLPDSIYVKHVDRITGMNNIDRSGDIILIFKDFINDVSRNRYTSGVACKSWHGSLNPSDSYVPFIVSYPGGNKSELEPLINNTPGCSMTQGCGGNWHATDLIQSIIRKQYSSN